LTDPFALQVLRYQLRNELIVGNPITWWHRLTFFLVHGYLPG
jgi:hypothetical protein